MKDVVVFRVQGFIGFFAEVSVRVLCNRCSGRHESSACQFSSSVFGFGAVGSHHEAEDTFVGLAGSGSDRCKVNGKPSPVPK